MEKLRKNAELIYQINEESDIRDGVEKNRWNMLSKWRESVDEELKLNIFGTRKYQRFNYI